MIERIALEGWSGAAGGGDGAGGAKAQAARSLLSSVE
jgi:hypothetical protein